MNFYTSSKIQDLAKLISFIHFETCWSYFEPCSYLPEPPSDDSPMLDENGCLHIMGSMVIDRSNNWDEMYRLIVGYSCEG